VHVVGSDPGEETRRKQHHDRGEPQPAREQLRADGEYEHEPEPEEDRV
jgi:hypothetical protein